jgi:hypothetical protein
MTTNTLHIGLADFAEPTLLILGEAASLNWLAERIEARQSFDLATAPVVKLANVRLLLEPTDNAGTLTREGKKFVWKLSLSESQEVAAQLRELAASHVPAHAYLDPKTNSAGVEVVASKGEYSDAVFVS